MAVRRQFILGRGDQAGYMLFDLAAEYARVARALASQFSPAVDHPGGCFTCRHFGERIDVAAWCSRPGGEHVRSQAERGCAFWMREPGADHVGEGT